MFWYNSIQIGMGKYGKGLKPADCKSVAFGLREFKSHLSHHLITIHNYTNLAIHTKAPSGWATLVPLRINVKNLKGVI